MLWCHFLKDLFWSAETCLRFSLPRLVAASSHALKEQRQVAVYESGDKSRALQKRELLSSLIPGLELHPEVLNLVVGGEDFCEVVLPEVAKRGLNERSCLLI